MPLLPTFESRRIDVGGVTLHVRTAGEGPPVLLLHGFPQTGAMWHAVAPRLAERFSVVCPDLRGYGYSDKPAGDATHVAYGKRALAAEQVALMRALGHERFAVVGHDRGARVAHRMCLDHTEAVTRAAVLDVVPTRHVLHHVDLALASTYEHWFFLGQPGDLPEQMIGADPGGYLRAKLDAWSGPGARFADEALAEYVRCFTEPAAVHASCEDYRAGLSADLADDDAAHAAGARVECPLLALWGDRSFVDGAYDVLDVWRAYARTPGLVSGRPLGCGHFLPEEAPGDTLAELLAFLP